MLIQTPFFPTDIRASTFCTLHRKFNDTPEKTHSLVFLVELLDLELPQQYLDSLFVINRIGVTGRYPHNLDEVLEQYTKEKTQKILSETQEILVWLMQKSSKR